MRKIVLLVLLMSFLYPYSAHAYVNTETFASGREVVTTIHGGKYQISIMDHHKITPSLILRFKNKSITDSEENYYSYSLYFACDYLGQYDLFSFNKLNHLIIQIGDKTVPVYFDNIKIDEKHRFTFASVEVTPRFLLDFFMELTDKNGAYITFWVPTNGLDSAIITLSEEDVYEFYRGITEFNNLTIKQAF